MVTVETSERLKEFIRRSASPAVVPLVPEITIWQAPDAAALWETSVRDPAGWPDLPYWAIPWAGGQALARHVLDHPELVRGRAVADFATGSGLVAIAAHRAGAARVVGLDLDPLACAAVELNAALNGATVEARLGDAIGDPLVGFDVVLVGDIFYERRLAERALPWLRTLARRGALVLAGDPGRNYTPRDAEALEPVAEYDAPAAAGVEGREILRTWVERIGP
jgi:predicted nicotinamide N-methyase